MFLQENKNNRELTWHKYDVPRKDTQKQRGQFKKP